MQNFLTGSLLVLALLITPIYSAGTNDLSFQKTYKPSPQVVTSEDGTKIHAEAFGDRRNPAVVLVHGFGCSLVHFKKQFEDSKLLKNVYMIAYDMRGHGRSGAPLKAEAYESVRYAEDFKAVIDKFGVVKPFVAGWSAGGFVPADVVAAYGPSSISGVILLGTAMGPDEDILSIVTNPQMAGIFAGFSSLDLPTFRSAALSFSTALYAVAFKVAFEEEQRFLGGMLTMHPSVRVWAAFRGYNGGAITSAQDELPFLVIQGAEDAAFNVTRVRDYMEQNGFKMEYHIFDGVGHSPFYEAPERTNRLILDFVRDHADN